MIYKNIKPCRFIFRINRFTARIEIDGCVEICHVKNCLCFVPNRRTHPKFADALEAAEKCGVKISCLNCKVNPNELTIKDFINVNNIETITEDG